jgi:hypothetical protein
LLGIIYVPIKEKRKLESKNAYGDAGYITRGRHWNVIKRLRLRWCGHGGRSNNERMPIQ